MKRLISYLVLLLCSNLLFAQGWVTKGVNVVVKDDAHIVLNGNTAHYTSRDSGIVLTRNSGTIHVDGNWINDGTNPAIGNNAGTVELTGNNQSIEGSTPTSFNNLTLLGSGIKTLQIDALVGGGYTGTRSGKIDLGTRHLRLNSNQLTINNPSSVSIARQTGLLIGDTDPLAGYSKVQWNVRSAPTGNKYVIPFGSVDFIYVPIELALVTGGSQIADSGYINVTTYPTNPIAVPNNRPLPIGIPHLDNKFKVENDIKTADRFYVFQTGGYSADPVVNLTVSYIDREWDATGGSLNDLLENELELARYDVSAGSWDYSFTGTSNTAANTSYTGTVTDLNGAWVLHNKPYCPEPNFTFDNECFGIPVVLNDSSYILRGTIDSTIWFYEGNQRFNQNSAAHEFSTDGFFTVKRKVRGDRGCWDSISKQVQVYPLPEPSFTYVDTCFTETTQFVATSTNTIGDPITHQWLIGGNTTAGNTASYRFVNDGMQPVRLIARSSLNCVDTIVRDIPIEPLPNVSFTFDNICEQQEAEFFDATTTKGNISEWQWSVNNRITSFQQDYNRIFNIAGTYPIQLNVTNDFGCKDSFLQNIVVYPKAKARFDVFPKDIYISDPFVNLVQSGADANSWEWRFGDGSPEEYGPEVMHEYLDTGVFRARLIASNDFQCGDTFYRTIIIKPDIRIWVPNAFSPGPENDVNTTFGPGGLLHGLKSMTMDVYTRWGEHIYHTESIHEPWDGSYMGELVQEGSYLYLIKIKDVYNNVYHHSGTLTVIR